MFYKRTLTNGMRLVVEEIPSVRSVSLGVWIHTGSRDESQSTNGISHFLEHMMFKGTEKRSARQIAELFDGIGGHVNAFTSKEYTCYYAKVLDEHFSIALETIADMLLNSKFDSEELAKERKVIIEEIKMYEDTPDDQVHDLMAATIYPDHTLGYTILGPEANLLSFTRDDIVNYVKARYTPDNMVLAVAGNVQIDEVHQAAEQFFSGLSGKCQQIDHRPPVFHANRQVRQKATEQAHICLSTTGFAFDAPEVYPLILLNNIVGGSSSSRLFQEIREERGMAYSVYSYYASYRDGGTFGVYAGTSPDQAQQVVDLTYQILAAVADKGVTEEELRKAKEQVKGSLMLSLESTVSRMNRVGKNELLLNKQVTLDETINRINEVSIDRLKQIAGQICGGPWAMAAIGPFNELNLPE
ncbi:M16 family metallopeptidase [Effusibacillus dendaii]|uniref:Peptidase M16 n=1 Tax=Effusibacillus dendaii TaxID=2743772 RepID=A0A7I8D922_9BACL|nr:pitrilysin family protein [Effusibacillus dendaii]BCJ85316.1 peptidase M16 [Effusibacillus dendaii]